MRLIFIFHIYTEAGNITSTELGNTREDEFMRNYRNQATYDEELAEMSRWRRYYTRSERQRREKYLAKQVRQVKRRRKIEKIKKAWNIISTVILIAFCVGMPIWMFLDAFGMIP